MSQARRDTGVVCDPKICEEGGGGTLLPLLAVEQHWDIRLRGVLYLCGLFYLFMGVAIVADVFMGAIEMITSKTIRIYDETRKRSITVKVWNATVANLSLMALGSSAPEILLSVIELLSGGFYSGELGPSTIVGSAAFNMHVIIAVCIVAIPAEEVRQIADVKVFVVTAGFSILAYLWLYFIVLLHSKDVIEIWEGAVTFVLFPLLVALAYAADKGYCGERDITAHRIIRSNTAAAEMSEEELVVLKKEAHRVHGNSLSDEDLAKLLAVMAPGTRSRASYRIDATRQLFGGRRVHSATYDAEDESCSEAMGHSVEPAVAEVVRPQTTIEFVTGEIAVMENVGTAKIHVQRIGDLLQRDTVDYKTVCNESATPGNDYKHTEGTLIFEPNDIEKMFEVPIIDDESDEGLETFLVELSNPRHTWRGGHTDIALGSISTVTVTIVDDDDPGELCFDYDDSEIHVQETGVPEIIDAVVRRKGGARGEITCKFRTESESAVAGDDYEATKGTLRFKDGQKTATIKLTILPTGKYEGTEEFRLVLEDVSGGARFCEDGDGGDQDCQILTIIIEPDEAERSRLDNVRNLLGLNYDKTILGYHSYASQFKAALSPSGGKGHDTACCWKEDEDSSSQSAASDELMNSRTNDGETEKEEEQGPTCFEYTMHFITLPWKLLFAVIPPAGCCGGWLCFTVSLCAIGVVTAFIGDLAALLGCVLGIPDSITAITLVALGTSLPDTFASKSAAIQDKTADASIGNVTGSNSVNVFLGLGLPWLMGAIYWTMSGRTTKWQQKYAYEEDFTSWDTGSGKFIVVGGDLGFSVGVFSVTAMVNLLTLFLRRKFVGGELGGPTAAKWSSAMFLAALWLVYVGLSSWKTLSALGDDPCA